MKSNIVGMMSLAAILCVPVIAEAGGLRGSAASMKEQHTVAVERDLTFSENEASVRALVETGGLEPIESNGDFKLSRVSFPYALPEVKLFLERLSRQYNDALGAPLVVTSLTRPAENQPRNAHQLSVHPAGMAVDFRVPRTAKERAWLESVLLQLENRGVLDVTRERNPPHYHVAVFPAAYRTYAAKLPPLAPRAVVTPLPVARSVAMESRPVMTVSAPTSVAASTSSFFNALLLVTGMSGVLFTTLLFRRRELV